MDDPFDMTIAMLGIVAEALGYRLEPEAKVEEVPFPSIDPYASLKAELRALTITDLGQRIADLRAEADAIRKQRSAWNDTVEEVRMQLLKQCNARQSMLSRSDVDASLPASIKCAEDAIWCKINVAEAIYKEQVRARAAWTTLRAFREKYPEWASD